MPSQKGNILLPLVIIILIVTLAPLAYLFGKHQNRPQEITSSPRSTEEPAKPFSTKTTDPTANWKTYTNNQYSYEIKYPNTFSEVGNNAPPGFIPVCEPETSTGCLIYSRDSYLNSDFEGAGISVNIIKESGTKEKCSTYAVINPQYPLKLSETRKVNGIDFYFGTNSGAATGHQSYSHIYRALHNNTCYEIEEKISTCSCKANSPESPNIKDFTQSDKNRVFETLDQVFSSFKFLDSPTPTSYTTCGCGCCGGVQPIEKCLYKSKGDDINRIITEDQSMKNSPICPQVGCSMGIIYKYCD